MNNTKKTKYQTDYEMSQEVFDGMPEFEYVSAVEHRGYPKDVRDKLASMIKEGTMPYNTPIDLYNLCK